MKKLLLASAFFLVSNSVQAEEAEAPSFTLQIPMLGYFQEQSDTSKQRALLSSSSDTYGWISYQGWNLYLYPFSSTNAVGLSRMFGESWELGLVGKVESSKEGDNSTEEHSFSPFVTNYTALTSSLNLESTLAYEMGSRITRGIDSTSGLKTKEEMTSSGYSLAFYLVHSFHQKFAGVLGIAIGQNHNDVNEISESYKGNSLDLGVRWNL